MDTLVWKRRISKLYPVRTRAIRKIILLYHSVGDSPQALDSNLFYRQMEWLHKYCLVKTLTDLISQPSQQKCIEVAISFDDGYACLFNEVAPILSHFNMSAIVYINTGWISDNESLRKRSDPNLGHYSGESFLVWDELRELVKQGWEIGSHGVEHHDLTICSEESIMEQLQQSKQMIEFYLKKPCTHFAYTWGKHTKNVRDNVQENNYQYAVAAHHATLKESDNTYALPRMNIEQGYSMDDFINIVQGKWDYLNIIHGLKKQYKKISKAF